jgi:hypothetical protein
MTNRAPAAGAIHFDQYKTTGFPGYHVEPAPGRHRFESVGDQVEEYGLHTTAYQRQLDSLRHFEKDLNATIFRVCACCIGCCSDDLPNVTHLRRWRGSKSNAVEVRQQFPHAAGCVKDIGCEPLHLRQPSIQIH